VSKVTKARKRRPAKPPSPEELERRRRQRNEARRLLYTRGQTGEALGGISVSSVIRLENEGKLRKVRLRGETGQVFNPVADVEALASAVEG
jgi:hypothetical protein